ncbi:angiopoietin-4-like [Anopheles aquasalis]|uniref:angiopoietin-4-like n=1 Tax=Anopheles aquasalis TaxID=42839 RepID=UPI00215AC2BD|nr:angiopoietin-4-like [Anopheles aquasalis]
MEHLVWCILVSLTVAANSDKPNSKTVLPNTPESSDLSGFALEIILSRLESLSHQFQTLQQEVQKQRESNDENRKQLQQSHELLAKMQQEMQQKHTLSQKSIADIRGVLSKDLQQKLTTLERDHKQMRNVLLDIELGSYRSCKDVPLKVSGQYKIRANEASLPFRAHCEQEQFDGGWLIIQHRFDGTLHFNRSWTEYRNGFGDVNGEHWLGLEKVYQFTKEHNCELFVQMMESNGTLNSARYNAFAIGSEAERYNLKILGTHSGTVDILAGHKGMKFSTPDRDNDPDGHHHYALENHGGWWFYNGQNTFLNGLYRNPFFIKLRFFLGSSERPALKFSRMLIRPLN